MRRHWTQEVESLRARVAFETRKSRSVTPQRLAKPEKSAPQRSHPLAQAPRKLPNRKRAFQIDAISMGCDPVRLGRNCGALRTFTKRLNLAAEASSGMRTSSQGIRKLRLRCGSFV